MQSGFVAACSSELEGERSRYDHPCDAEHVVAYPTSALVVIKIAIWLICIEEKEIKGKSVKNGGKIYRY